MLKKFDEIESLYMCDSPFKRARRSVMRFNEIKLLPNQITVTNSVQGEWRGRIEITSHTGTVRRADGMWKFVESRTHPGCMRCVFKIFDTGDYRVLIVEGKRFVIKELTFILGPSMYHRAIDRLLKLDRYTFEPTVDCDLPISVQAREVLPPKAEAVFRANDHNIWHKQSDRGWRVRPVSVSQGPTPMTYVVLNDDGIHMEYETRGDAKKDAESMTKQSGRPHSVLYVSAVCSPYVEPPAPKVQWSNS